MINGKHGQGTQITKMGADKLAENTEMPQNLLTNLRTQAQKFGFLMKEVFIWRP